MSGPIRRGRSVARSAVSSPYARTAPKKSSWSISSLFSYFNPLRSRSQSEEYSLGSDDSDPNAAETLSSRGHQISESMNAKAQSQHASLDLNHDPPASASSISSTSPTNATFNHDASPQQGLDYLSRYLGERPRNEPLSSVEAQELISIIQKSTPEHETFRFSSSPSSTPLRGNSPLTNSVPFSFSPSYLNPATLTPNPSSTKLLKQNPNGIYRWEGGGSAKPARSRNRFHSPAFGPSPRPSTSRLVLRESPEKAAEPFKSETKRRRLGEDALTSSPTPSGFSGAPPRSAAPPPSPNRVAEAQTLNIPFTPDRMSSSTARIDSKVPQVNGMKSSASTSRLRAPPKPTAPVVPSPLRQAWGQSSSPTPSSKSSDDGSPSGQRATKAASYMSELIKEVTPVKNLDVSNPYQAASPVRIVGNPKPKPKPIRKTRVSGRPLGPPETAVNGNGKEKEKEKPVEEKYSAQAIIEATLPKGSKRSRAPASIGKGLPNGISSTRSPSPTRKTQSSFSVEEVEDDEEESRSGKKSKGHNSDDLSSGAVAVNGHSKKGSTSSSAAPVIEEIDDDDMSGQASTTPSEIIEIGNGKTSTPVFSFPTSTSTRSGSSGSGQKVNAIPREPSKLRFSYQPEPTTPPPTASNEPAPNMFAFGEKFNKSSSNSTVTQPPSVPSAFPDFIVKAAAPTVPTLAVPSSTAPNTKPKAVVNPKEYVRSLAVSALPVFSFEDEQPIASGSGLSSKSSSKAMAAAKELSPSNLPQFDFDATMPMASSSKATTFGPTSLLPPPPPPPPPPPKTFNWSAAGLKAPDASEWECSQCMIKNKDASATKCAVCEADRPGLATTAATKTFDWVAAGLKSGDGAGEWTCSTCMLKNPASADTKCTICDAPKSSTSSSSITMAPATAPIQTPIQSFNWGAAGLKPPERKAGLWKCAYCGLDNVAEVVKCDVCETPK